jgi:oligopeptide/dipeptide ABC transporter ATP-binding protein
MPEPLLRVEEVVKHYASNRGLIGNASEFVHALDGVDLELGPGETVGIVGESGSGKSTLARLIAMLELPTAGRIVFGGRDLTTLGAAERRAMRRRIQIVFQDPASALNPRMQISTAVREPLDIHSIGTKAERRARVDELLANVGLGPEHASRYPRQLSGGQLQRAVIARALALEPELLVLDEPTSALDVLVQAEILQLLLRLQRESGISLVFITHDLAVAYQVTHRVSVMYLGKVVEEAPSERVFTAAHHPYSQALLSAVPGSPQDRIVLRGERPSALDPPAGCRFRTRCWKAEAMCSEAVPPLLPIARGHTAACFFAAPPEAVGRP